MWFQCKALRVVSMNRKGLYNLPFEKIFSKTLFIMNIFLLPRLCFILISVSLKFFFSLGHYFQEKSKELMPVKVDVMLPNSEY